MSLVEVEVSHSSAVQMFPTRISNAHWAFHGAATLSTLVQIVLRMAERSLEAPERLCKTRLKVIQQGVPSVLRPAGGPGPGPRQLRRALG